MCIGSRCCRPQSGSCEDDRRRPGSLGMVLGELAGDGRDDDSSRDAGVDGHADGGDPRVDGGLFVETQRVVAGEVPVRDEGVDVHGEGSDAELLTGRQVLVGLEGSVSLSHTRRIASSRSSALLGPQNRSGGDVGEVAGRARPREREPPLTPWRGRPEDDGVGFSPRYAYLDENDRANSMTKTRCHAVFRGAEALASFASKRVRFASVYVELEERVPVRILQEDYMVLEFDHGGFLSASASRRVQFAFTSSVELWGLLDAGLAREDVVRAEDQEVLDAARWKPVPLVRREILIACRLGHLAEVG